MSLQQGWRIEMTYIRDDVPIDIHTVKEILANTSPYIHFRILHDEEVLFQGQITKATFSRGKDGTMFHDLQQALDKLNDHEDTEECDKAIIPGHQSTSICTKKGKHSYHTALNGQFCWEDSEVESYRAVKRGARTLKVVSSGFFDNDHRNGW